MVRYALPIAMVRAFPQSVRELREILTMVKRLVTGKMSMQMLGGPVRIFEVSYYVGKQKGLAYFILLFAKIGFSLAVLNMLPIPVLDGGHAVMILIEMVRKKPLNQEIMVVINFIGILALIGLFVFVFYNDIMKLISR